MKYDNDNDNFIHTPTLIYNEVIVCDYLSLSILLNTTSDVSIMLKMLMKLIISILLWLTMFWIITIQINNYFFFLRVHGNRLFYVLIIWKLNKINIFSINFKL